MEVNKHWRGATGVSSFLLFSATILYLIAYGQPDNSLHTSALSWSYTGLIGLMISVGFSGVLTSLTFKDPKNS